MTDVYISYQRNEIEFARTVAAALRQVGLSTWLDVEDVAPGAQWSVEIPKAIKGANAVIVLVSDTDAKSASLASEVAHALSLRKTIVPVKCAAGVSITAAEVKYMLGRFRWVEFHSDLEATVNQILHVLGLSRAAPREIANAAEPAANKGYAFISYCHADYPFRDRLVSHLKDNGYLFWEYGEGERELEKMLALEIESKILESKIVLSVVSENWKKSIWCVKEFFFAKEVQRPVFLLKSGAMGPSLALAGETFIDFMEDEGRGFEQLSRELRRRGL